ncbi:MAG: hypothetical protein AAB356_03875 [Deltaproteobacteria bacterium]
MPIAGVDFGSRLGPLREAAFVATNSGVVAYAMTALNTGWCARFTALSTKDVKSVRLNWITTTAPGVVALRIETIDATTGKPTGTLYDANATYSIIPAAGVQTYTFAILPATGMVAGAEYAIVLLTTTAGTTHSLGSGANPASQAHYSTIVLTEADGTIRSNFAEVANYSPCASLVWEDDSEDALGMLPYYSFSNNYTYGNVAAASKIVTPKDVNIAAIVFDYIGRAGTPAGDLRVRIFDSADNTVTGSTVTVDKESLLNAGGRQLYLQLPYIINLTAGTYRIVLDSAGSANSVDCFNLRGCKFLAAAAVPSNYKLSITSNLSATPIVWTDSTTDIAPIALVLDSFPSAAGGGLLTHPGMTGGIRG